LDVCQNGSSPGKAGFFAGALELRAGDDGSAELGRACSELLALGQLDFLGQELAAAPDVAAQLAAAGATEDELRELLRVSALQVGGPALVASLAGQDARLLALSISLARTDLPEREASELLQALRRHRSREVRDRARRVDLGPGAPARLFLELTDREEEVLALLAEGCSNAEIARRLVLTIGTVKTHVHRILTKTETHGRLAAAVLYRKRTDAAGEAAYGNP
jgi:DNA-binding NarL/FixJ family response regulator